MKLINTANDQLKGSWIKMVEEEVDFSSDNFRNAMENLIFQPQINSTVILRADVVVHNKENTPVEIQPAVFDSSGMVCHNLGDIIVRSCVSPFVNDVEIVRRIVPRNPFKDAVINQTCLIQKDANGSVFVVYTPHIFNEEEVPYYLPKVQSVGILFAQGAVSVNYIPFVSTVEFGVDHRDSRIAFRLLQTACKHSQGLKRGYTKRVLHDQVVPRTRFQDRYLLMKNKYAHTLVNSWQESTDPKKHVFEDIAIASFLIELWTAMGRDKDAPFVDVGCGNGVLVWLLRQEGFQGYGIDARARKTWAALFPDDTSALREQVLIPHSLLLTASSPELTANPGLICDAQFPSRTFLIGNHCDELTLWIPLLGYSFMVLPCCSHALSGARWRFSRGKVSGYAALVDHTESLAQMHGWITQREMLRIPSTRNCAIIGIQKGKGKTVEEILEQEGGAQGWIENCVKLMKRPPSLH